MQVPVSVALVGGGPRGLWAAEELVRVARERGLRFDITVFDGQPLGVGAAYRLDQPDFYLLNVEAQRIFTGWGLFNDFRQQVLGEQLPLSVYPPRRAVGQFLQASWLRCFEQVPEGSSLRHCQMQVSRFDQLLGFDFVLVATGHEPFPQVEGMFSAYEDLSDLEPGSRVALRGAALSCIDTILALTVGRGGRFTAAGYEASGWEPARLIPYSRSGSFIPMKPPAPAPAEERFLRASAVVLERVESGEELRAAVLALASKLDGRQITWEQLAPELEPVDLMRASLARPRLPHQTVGMVWKALYGQVIERVSFGRLPLSEHLRETIRCLKPLTFGAPREQVERLLALVDAGLLDLSQLDQRQSISADYWVTTVQAPAGLRQEGLVFELARYAGADVSGDFLRTDNCGFVGAQQRLAVVGRVTEPYILGNDTISRHNHSIIPAWADAVGRLVQSGIL